jgi:hypothetical protein
MRRDGPESKDSLLGKLPVWSPTDRVVHAPEALFG